MSLDSVVAFEGAVTQFNWRNPHVYIAVATTGEQGERIEWALQTSPTNLLARRGWTRESLAIGERVMVRAHPAEDGRPYALLVSIRKEDGTPLRMESDAPEVTASTSTLEGRWIADTSILPTYPGGFDGFFKAHLKLTEKGRAAEAAYDPLSDENPESTCIGRPTPGALISSGLYLIEIDSDEDEETVVIRSEYFDEERTVYMDGRRHPAGGERGAKGHSIGWWDGETLVVDTANFADHRSPYQIGVPSGAEKHVVERYRLNEDGTRIIVEFVLEDPEYLAEPLFHTRELIYSPHMAMFRFDCDPEVTRRFVPR